MCLLSLGLYNYSILWFLPKHRKLLPELVQESLQTIMTNAPASSTFLIIWNFTNSWRSRIFQFLHSSSSGQLYNFIYKRVNLKAYQSRASPFCLNLISVSLHSSSPLSGSKTVKGIKHFKLDYIKTHSKLERSVICTVMYVTIGQWWRTF